MAWAPGVFTNVDLVSYGFKHSRVDTEVIHVAVGCWLISCDEGNEWIQYVITRILSRYLDTFPSAMTVHNT